MELNSLNELKIISNTEEYFYNNSRGSKLYNIDKILQNLDLKNGKKLVIEVCNIMKERKVNNKQMVLDRFISKSS